MRGAAATASREKLARKPQYDRAVLALAGHGGAVLPHVVEGTRATPQVQTGREGAGHVGLGGAHGHVHGKAPGQAAGDGRGEGAAGKEQSRCQEQGSEPCKMTHGDSSYSTT